VGGAALAVIVASLWPLVDERLERTGPAGADAVAAAGNVPAVVVEAEPAATESEPTSEPLPEVEPDVEPDVETDPAPAATIDDQLLMAGELTGLASAFETLFGLWGIEFSAPIANGCEMARSKGYACLMQQGSWSSLRQLDRPAILKLTDSGGRTHHVVLTALHGDRAELSIAGVSVMHPFLDVADAWFGDYILLWKPQNGVAFALGRGSRGNSVVWLRQSLAAIDDRYRAEPLDSSVYDEELERRVIAFQRDHRLEVDGLAGQQTQIIINSLLGAEDTPRLKTSRLARE
jgi:general secretion pathway protein A